MGGKHSSESRLENGSKSNPKNLTNGDEITPDLVLPLLQQATTLRKISCHRSKELTAAAVAEANEHFFMENARYHRARLSISVRSLFTTATSATLSERQKSTIKQTWKLAISDGKLKPGVTIFQNIFRRCPDLKEIFRLSHVENMDDLPKEERFLRHANVFSDVIDLAVRNMDELDAQMAPALIVLGRRHFYKHNVGFRTDYLAVFAQAMIDFVSERLHLTGDKEAVDGWWLITVYLVSKLQHGYALESMGKSSKSKFRRLTMRGKMSV